MKHFLFLVRETGIESFGEPLDKVDEPDFSDMPSDVVAVVCRSATLDASGEEGWATTAYYASRHSVYARQVVQRWRRDIEREAWDQFIGYLEEEP